MLNLIICIIFSYLVCAFSKETIREGFKKSNIFDNKINTNNLLDSIRTANYIALEYCQDALRWERWNCPKDEFQSYLKQPPTKESAFTKAIISATVVHTIIKSCSNGEIPDCGCIKHPNYAANDIYYDEISIPNDSPHSKPIRFKLNREAHQRPTTSWRDCSDDINFAVKVAKELFENINTNLDIFKLIDRHNYRVGREIVQKSLVKKCRCHGISGACVLKHCFVKVGSLDNIVKKLREKYYKSIRLTMDHIHSYHILINSIKKEEKEKYLSVPESELIYIQSSPDYCEQNLTSNWPGTRNRQCSKSSEETATFEERKSCRKLCKQCGYKVKKEKKLIEINCNCKFEWCCLVKCDKCIEIVNEYYCS